MKSTSKIPIAALCFLLTGCASGSTYTLRLDDTSSLRVTEISRPNPVSPSNQYTVLWFCKDVRESYAIKAEPHCTPKALDHVSTHGWLVGLLKDAITSTSHVLGVSRVSSTSISTSESTSQIKGGKK